MVLDIILGVLVVLLAIAYIYQLRVTKKQSEESADLLRDYQRRLDEQQRLFDDYQRLEKSFDNVGKGYEKALLAFDKIEEEKQMLTAWANDVDPEKNQEHAIQVYIGEESPIESMKDCSVVTATYQIEEGVYGKIGIVGPKRMDYEKVVGTLENCMQQLDDIFKKKEKALPDKSKE